MQDCMKGSLQWKECQFDPICKVHVVHSESHREDN